MPRLFRTGVQISVVFRKQIDVVKYEALPFVKSRSLHKTHIHQFPPIKCLVHFLFNDKNCVVQLLFDQQKVQIMQENSQMRLTISEGRTFKNKFLNKIDKCLLRIRIDTPNSYLYGTMMATRFLAVHWSGQLCPPFLTPWYSLESWSKLGTSSQTGMGPISAGGGLGQRESLVRGRKWIGFSNPKVPLVFVRSSVVVELFVKRLGSVDSLWDSWTVIGVVFGWEEKVEVDTGEMFAGKLNLGDNWRKRFFFWGYWRKRISLIRPKSSPLN